MATADLSARPAEKTRRAVGRPAMSEAFLHEYRTVCYRAIGRHFDQPTGHEALAEHLRRAGSNVSPGMWVGLVVLTTALAAGAAGAAGVLLFRLLIPQAMWYEYAGLLSAVAAASTYLGFRALLDTRIANRKDQLDRELPFTFSELSVLASTGTSPIQLMRRMASRDHDPGMTGEFRRVVFKTDIEGKDLITALVESAKESPSNNVRESFWDLSNMVHQGGNLDEYLRKQSEDILRLRRLTQKEFIERLSAFLDVYVALVLVGVLLIAVGAYLLNALGLTIAGIDANELLLLLTYGIVPIAVIMTTVMISMAYARVDS